MEKERILVVEDQGLISLYIKDILLSEGYMVSNDCFKVDSAIQKITEEKFDLVIIDINLKDRKTGIDLAQYLLELGTIPYIFITSYSDKVTLEKIKNVRPYGYLVKPFKKEDLVAMVYLVINNFSHRKVDVNRYPNKALTDFPLQIKAAVDYINKNLDRKIEISELAAITKWEAEHFIRIFKEYMSITPYQYILKAKIDLAKSLLKSSNYSLEEIAIESGFSNYSAFYKVFLRAVEMSPRTYRSIIKPKEN